MASNSTHLHAVSPAAAEPDPAGDAPAPEREETSPPSSPEPKGRELSKPRRDAAPKASRIVARALAEASSLRCEAKKLEVSKAQIERWADADHPASMSIRDICAGTPAFRKLVGLQLLAGADAEGESAGGAVSVEMLRLQGYRGRLAATAIETLEECERGELPPEVRAVLLKMLRPLFSDIDRLRAALSAKGGQ